MWVDAKTLEKPLWEAVWGEGKWEERHGLVPVVPEILVLGRGEMECSRVGMALLVFRLYQAEPTKKRRAIRSNTNEDTRGCGLLHGF